VELGFEPAFPQGGYDRAHLRQVRVDAQIDVFGVTNVAMGGKCHRPDDYGRDSVCGEQGNDAFSGPQVAFGVGHDALGSGWG